MDEIKISLAQLQLSEEERKALEEELRSTVTEFIRRRGSDKEIVALGPGWIGIEIS